MVINFGLGYDMFDPNTYVPSNYRTKNEYYNALCGELITDPDPSCESLEFSVPIKTDIQSQIGQICFVLPNK